MSWVTDSLKQRKPAPPLPEVKVTSRTSPAWESVWKQIAETIERDVLEFNEARGHQYMVSTTSVLVQVIPKQPPTDLAVIQVDPNTGTVQFDCPISHPGTPRRGQFKIGDGRIVASGNFVGPQPPSGPIPPEQLSEFILEPLLFPE